MVNKLIKIFKVKDLKQLVIVFLVFSITGSLSVVLGEPILEFFFDQTHQVAQTDASISDHTLALMELSEMSSIQSLISKDPIDGEIFDGLEFFLLSQFIEHLRRNCGGVSSQNILACFILFPFVLVTL